MERYDIIWFAAVVLGGAGAQPGCCEPDEGVSIPGIPDLIDDADGDGFDSNEDCDDHDPLTHPGPAGQPPWALDPCESWERGHALFGPTTDIAPEIYHSGDCGEVDCHGASTEDSAGTVDDWPDACGGRGAVIGFDLRADCGCGAWGEACCDEHQAWVSVRWDSGASEGFDLSDDHFLLLPFQGTPGSRPMDLQPKLEDRTGCRVQLNSYPEMTDLPVLRTLVIPLALFETRGECAIDLEHVTAVEIGVVDPDPDPGEARRSEIRLGWPATADVDSMRIPMESFDCPVQDAALADRVASSLVRLQQPHGFVPTWIHADTGAADPLLNVYGESVALILLSSRAARTDDPEYVDAARALAETLVRLQLEDGSWRDAYLYDSGAGTWSEGTDAVWSGNVAWCVLALQRYAEQVGGADSALLDAIDRGASWLVREMSAYRERGGATGGVTDGGEGNVSTYFALSAAGRRDEADQVAAFVLEHLWDEEAGYLWMGIDNPGLALDMFSWGGALLRAVGRTEDALLSMGLAQGVFPTTDFGGDLTGMADMGPYQCCWEFTGQWIASSGGGAAYLGQQILEAELDLDADGAPDGLWRGCADDYGGGEGWETSMVGIPPSVWAALAATVSPFEF